MSKFEAVGKVGVGCFAIGCIGVILIALPIVGCAAGWFGEANRVAREQVGPAALLKKYEWFKDQAAALDKSQADIGIYEARVKAIESAYVGKDRKDWPRDERESHRQAQAELVGMKANYNRLASEYNAAMAKENYRFANAGELPEGASKPLPREFRTYQEK